ncbi:MAG: polymer-forming cytoskeletal protein, partial [Desulfobacterales bacterium]
NVNIAVIMGKVNGTIDARKRIEIYPPASVVGDIRAPTILIESGVMFNGNCSMKAQAISSKKPVSITESVQKFPIQKEGQIKTDSIYKAPYQRGSQTEADFHQKSPIPQEDQIKADSIQKAPIPQEGQIKADSIQKSPVQKEGQAKYKL